MTWTKLSDDFSDDAWRLSDKAFRLHVEGLVWSNRKLLDLVLLKDEVQRWAKRPEAADELVERGWWEDWGDRYYIVHHGSYQRSADAVVNQQKVNKENRAKRGIKTSPAREQAKEIRPSNDSLVDSLHESTNERDRTGQDGPGREEGAQNVSQLPLAAGAERTVWRGGGPDPYDEYK